MRAGKWKSQIRLATWLALLALGLTLWLTIAYFAIILEVGWILFGALLLSLVMRPVVDGMAGWRIPRPLTVLLLYLLVLGVLMLIGSLVIPLLVEEVSNLRQNGPAQLQHVVARLASAPPTGWLPSFDTIGADMVQQLDTVLLNLVETAAGVGQLGLDLLVLLALSYFFTVDPRPSYLWVSRWFAREYESHVQTLWNGVTQRLTRWIWAQAGIALYVAVVFSIGLSLLGVPYAVTIGLAGGLLEIVPYLGSAITLILALLSAATVNLWLVLWVLIFYAIATVIESNIVAPVLYGRALGIRSGFVLLVIVTGFKMGGIVGVIFAVPVVVLLSALAEELRSVSTPDQGSPDAATTSPSAGADWRETLVHK